MDGTDEDEWASHMVHFQIGDEVFITGQYGIPPGLDIPMVQEWPTFITWPNSEPGYTKYMLYSYWVFKIVDILPFKQQYLMPPGSDQEYSYGVGATPELKEYKETPNTGNQPTSWDYDNTRYNTSTSYGKEAEVIYLLEYNNRTSSRIKAPDWTPSNPTYLPNILDNDYPRAE